LSLLSFIPIVSKERTSKSVLVSVIVCIIKVTG
jgi:hypothetical protein